MSGRPCVCGDEADGDDAVTGADVVLCARRLRDPWHVAVGPDVALLLLMRSRASLKPSALSSSGFCEGDMSTVLGILAVEKAVAAGLMVKVPSLKVPMM